MDPGISALIVARADLPVADEVVLELVAVLDGLVGEHFEIVLIGGATDSQLLARYPNLPLRVVDADLRVAVDQASYDLLLVLSAEDHLDARELNHFLEAIEHGADLAVGYRPLSFARVTWSALGALLFGKTARDVECPFKLFRRSVWDRTEVASSELDRWFCTRLVVRARRLGFRVAELPVYVSRQSVKQSSKEMATRRAA
jgi:hypothetical protein